MKLCSTGSVHNYVNIMTFVLTVFIYLFTKYLIFIYLISIFNIVFAAMCSPEP